MIDPGQLVGDLPWPFRPCDHEPFHYVEIAPNEWIMVALASDYMTLLRDYLQLRAAAEAQVKAAEQVVDVWEHYGHRHE